MALPPPAPVINGTSKDCASWWTVVNLDGQPDPCLAALVSAQNLTIAQFQQLNPDINSTCTNLKVGYAYCLQGTVTHVQRTHESDFNLDPASDTSPQSFASASIGTSVSTTTPSTHLPSLVLPFLPTEARNGTHPQGVSASIPTSSTRLDAAMTPPTSAAPTNQCSLPPNIPPINLSPLKTGPDAYIPLATSLPLPHCTPVTYSTAQEGTVYGVDSSSITCQTHVYPNGTVYHHNQPKTTATIKMCGRPFLTLTISESSDQTDVVSQATSAASNSFSPSLSAVGPASYTTPSPQLEAASSPSLTRASLTSSLDPAATEDATFPRPSECSGNCPTTEITVTVANPAATTAFGSEPTLGADNLQPTPTLQAGPTVSS